MITVPGAVCDSIKMLETLGMISGVAFPCEETIRLPGFDAEGVLFNPMVVVDDVFTNTASLSNPTTWDIVGLLDELLV